MIDVRPEVEGDVGGIDALLEAAFGGSREEPERIVALRRPRSFQRKEIVVGSLDGVEGEFVYHGAFEAVAQ